MKQKLAYYFIISLLFLGKILPKRTIYKLSHWILMLYYRAKPKRVGIMHGNIKRVFPEKSEEEIVAFGNKVYLELSKTVAECVLLYHDRIDVDRMVINTDEVLEKLERLATDSERGFLIVTGHYSNWELLGEFLGYHGFSVMNIVRKFPSLDLDEKIITPFRERHGNQMVEKEGAMIPMVKALKAGKNISLLIDQVVQPPNGVVVDLFGYQTAATKVIAMLKLKYDPLVVPIFITRIGDERFEVVVHDPVEVVFDGGLPEEEKIVVMTQAYYDIIEEQIRQAPTQWLWLYNRWKEIRYVK